MGRPWTLKEKQTLKEKYGKVGIEKLAKEINHTPTQICAAAKRMGVKSRILLEDVKEDFLKEYKLGKTNGELAKIFFVSKTTVARWLDSLGLKSKYDCKTIPNRVKKRIRRKQKESWKKRKRKGDRRYRNPIAKKDSIVALRIYQEDESEFLKEIIKWREKHKRVPSLLEGFKILKSLGWSKE